MTDIASLGFGIDSSPLTTSASAMDNLAKAAAGVDVATAKATAGVNAVGAAAKATTAAAVAQTSALNKAASAHGAHGAAANNNAIATLELFHVTRSLTEATLAGVNPLQALAFEFSRITTLLQYSGGLSGTLNLVGGYLSKLLNPIILVGGALVGLGAAGVLAFTGWENRINALQVALNGLGRATGQTVGSLEAIAERGAAAGHLSLSAAQGYVAQATGAGISGGIASQILGSAQRFGNVTGQSTDDAVKQLVQVFSDPVRGAQTLNKTFGMLDDATLQNIKNLSAQGDTIQASQILFNTLNGRLQESANTLSFWQQQNKGFGNFLYDILTPIRALAGATLPRSALPIEQQWEMARRDAGGSATGGLTHPVGMAATLAGRSVVGIGGGNLPGALSGEADLGEQMRMLQFSSASAAQTQITNAQSVAAGELARSLSSDSTAYQKLTDDLGLLKSTSAGAVAEMKGGVDVYGNLATGAQLYAQSVGQVTHAHDTFITSFQREIAAGQIEIQSLAARTVAEKAAVEVARERLALSGQQVTADQAQILVDQKLNLVLGEANKRVADNSRQVVDAAATAGMSGFALQAAQLKQEYQHLMEEAGTSHTITMQVPAPPPSPAPASAVSMAQKMAAQLTARPLGSNLDPGADSHAGFGDLSKAVDAVGSAASSATPAMQTITKTVSDGGNAAKITADYWTKFGTLVKNVTQPAIDDASKSIDAQNALLQVQKDTFGQSAGAIAAATEKQQLLNQFAKEGITEATIGAPAYAALVAQVGALAGKFGASAQASKDFEESQQRVTDAVNTVRSAASSGLSTFISDLRQGKSEAIGISDALNSIEDKLLDFAENQVITSLFGTGTAGGSQGAFGGSLFSLAKSVFSSGGNVVTSRGAVPLRRYAAGGIATSPQLSVFGEGSMPEAYVPLPDGRAIPVTVRGGQQTPSAGGATNVQIINNHPSATVTTKPATLGPTGEKQIQIMVDQALTRSIVSNGLAARTMQQRYGLSRAAGAAGTR